MTIKHSFVIGINMTEYIQVHQEGQINWITIDDGKANAVTHEIILGIQEKLKESANSEACRGVVITGRKKFLSAGFDLKSMQKGDRYATDLVEAGGRLLLQLYEFPKPMVIGATGHAMAMGAILLFAADYSIGITGNYKIGLNESAIGLALPWIAVHLAKEKLSRKFIDRVVAGAEIFSPEQALEVGFYDKLVTEDSLKGSLENEIIRLSQLDPAAFMENKKRIRADVIRRLTDHLEQNGGFWA